MMKLITSARKPSSQPYPLVRKERYFIFQPAAVAGEAAVRADDAVTRNDDADWIPSDRATDRLCRSPAPAL